MSIKKYKHIIVMSLLTISSALAGVAMAFFAVEHVWLMVLFVFCLVSALAIEKEV